MRIFLIEDESLALEELAHLMQPYADQHTIVCCENGEDAIEKALKAAPDIVISDIRMPGLSGLETLQTLSRINPQLQAIMLSGYNDFEYARTAIQLGAKGYLLKPVAEKEMHEAMDRLIASSISEEHKLQAVKDWSLIQMIRGLHASPGTENGIELKGNWLICVLLLRNWNSEHTWASGSLTASQLRTWLQTHFHRDAKCFDLDLHIRIALVPVQPRDTDSRLRHAANQVHDFVCSREKVVHTVYRMKNEQEALDVAYLHCLRRLEDQVRLDSSTFMPIVHSANVSLAWDSARLIEAHLRDGEYAKLKAELRRMLERLHGAGIPLKQLSLYLSDFLYALKYNLNRSKNDTESYSTDSIYEYIKSCDNYDQLHEWLLGRLGGMMAVQSAAMSQPKQIIPVLLDYVQQHYSETIHLQSFAAQYHLSTGYLSKLFKSETGSNFSEYIMDVRMKKAQELLDRGYTKISEISKWVGYEDPKFFSQTFKRWSGVSPQDYYKRK